MNNLELLYPELKDWLKNQIERSSLIDIRVREITIFVVSLLTLLFKGLFDYGLDIKSFLYKLDCLVLEISIVIFCFCSMILFLLSILFCILCHCKNELVRQTNVKPWFYNLNGSSAKPPIVNLDGELILEKKFKLTREDTLEDLIRNLYAACKENEEHIREKGKWKIAAFEACLVAFIFLFVSISLLGLAWLSHGVY